MNLSVKCTKGCYDNTPPVSDRAPLVLFSINVTDYKVEYCTLVGGNSHVGLSLSGHIGLVLNDGHLIMFGGVRLSEFPTTPGVYQEHFGGNPSKWDGYLFEFDPEACGLPDAPRNLTAKAGDRSVSLEWAPHTNVGYRVLKYSIYWGTINGTWDYDETIDGTAMGSDYPGLINGVRYYFGVAAVNTMGEGQ